MIDLVVFDMAGTTVHDGDAVNACFRAALAGVGTQADPEVVKTVMGLPKPEAIRALLAQASRQCTDKEIHVIHDDFARRMREYYATDPSVREIPGAMEAFAVLRRAGVKVALNTGFNRAITDTILARLGWKAPEAIDACVTSDEVPRGRPHPDMIQALMAQLAVREAHRVAKVGDTRADLEEGANAGCGMVIGVTSGSYSRDQLLAIPHTHLVDSVVEVPALVLPLCSPNQARL
jgi:phosphonatase-like hydrolase